MAICDHIWPYIYIYMAVRSCMAIDGHCWPLIAIHGHMQPYTAICGHIRPCVTIYGQLWTIGGHMWPYVTTYGRLWLYIYIYIYIHTWPHIALVLHIYGRMLTMYMDHTWNVHDHIRLYGHSGPWQQLLQAVGLAWNPKCFQEWDVQPSPPCTPCQTRSRK